MKINRIFPLIIQFLLLIGLLGFSSCSSEKRDNVQPNTKEIAILKFTDHPALNELETGFINQFNSLLKSNNIDSIDIRKYNADRDSQKAKSQAEIIVNKENSVLVLAIATPAAIAVSNTPSNIPFLYGAVADPLGSHILSENQVSMRVTGIQNAGPNIIRDAVTFIKFAFPNVKTIGSLYNPSEENSVYVQNLMKFYCDSLSIKLIQKPVYDAVQVSSMTENLLNDVDVIYSANDNTVNSAVATVVAICDAKKKPFIIGDLSTLDAGALFAIGLEYKSMGIELANMAFDIVVNKKKISDYPPQGPPKPQIWMNSAKAEKLELAFPDSCLSKINKTI